MLQCVEHIKFPGIIIDQNLTWKNHINYVILHIRLRALRLPSWLILKKYLYASFSFSY